MFTALIAEYMKDDEYRAFQAFLAGEPEAGDVIPGTGGFRKLRWADRRRGKGKRGGLRVIYYYLLTDAQIWVMALYDKGAVADPQRGREATIEGSPRCGTGAACGATPTSKEVNYGSKEATRDPKEAQPLP